MNFSRDWVFDYRILSDCEVGSCLLGGVRFIMLKDG